MIRRAIWSDPVSENMGIIPMSDIHEWLVTARRDLLVKIGKETHTVLTWLESPEKLMELGAGPNIFQRTYARSVSFRDILEGGWRSGRRVANCVYYMSPAVFTEGTIHVVLVTVKPLGRLKGWRLRRRAVSVAAAAPPRLPQAPHYVDSEVIPKPPEVISL